MRAPEAEPSVTFQLHGPSASHVDAKLADLRLTAATFRTLADDCDEHVTTVLAIEWNLPLRGDLLAPVTSATCATSITTLALGWHGLQAAALKARFIAVMLDLSVEAYEAAEVAAGELVDAVALPYDLAMTGAALAKVVSSARSDGQVDATIVQRVAPEAIDLVVQTVSDVLPGSYAMNLAEIEALTAAVAGRPRRVATTMTSRPGDGKGTTSVSSISEAAGRIPRLYENADAAGHVQVQRTVDPATGKGAWTVILPGTSTFAPNGKNAFNGHGNLIAASGRKSPTEEAVFAALRQAMAKEGVAGKGEPVMVVGHSQGGMVATNMARHSGSEFNISHVVTYGSPVGHLKVPQHTQVLNVENTEDLVARVDGRATGDGEPNRLRVTFDDPGSLTGKDGRPDPIEAHDMSRYAKNYATMSAMARSQPGSALTEFETSTEPFFRGDAHTYGFDLATVDPMSSPRPGPAPKSQPAVPDIPLGHRPGLSVK